jgi:hypothetical protein
MVARCLKVTMIRPTPSHEDDMKLPGIQAVQVPTARQNTRVKDTTNATLNLQATLQQTVNKVVSDAPNAAPVIEHAPTPPHVTTGKVVLTIDAASTPKTDEHDTLPNPTNQKGPARTLYFGTADDVFCSEPIPRKPKSTMVTPDNNSNADLNYSSDDGHVALADLKKKRALLIKAKRDVAKKVKNKELSACAPTVPKYDTTARPACRTVITVTSVPILNYSHLFTRGS